MSATSWATEPVVHQLGWTLIQFLWQGTAIALVYAVARTATRALLAPAARYALACAALAAMVAAPLLTFLSAFGTSYALPSRWQLGTGGWEPLVPWFVAGWIGGVIAFSVRLAGGWLVAHRLRQVGVHAVPDEWQRTFDVLVQRLRVSAPVRLLASTRVDVPMVVGWLQPVILVPVGTLTGLQPEFVKALLAHELAHVRRGDYLVNLLQRVAEALLFYHPAIWWVSEQVRLEREMCCDDIAVAAHGDALAYAQALATLEARRRVHTAALAANGPSLLHRIRRLLGHSGSAWQLLPGPGALVTIGLLWAIGIAGLGAQDPVAALDVPARSPVAVATPPGQISTAPALLAAALFGPLGPPPQTPRPGRVGAPGPGVAPGAREKAAPTPGIISGRVVRMGSGEPLLKAQVTVSGETLPNPLTVTTDNDGRYVLPPLPPGRYTLWAAKSGFVTLQYGQRTPSDSATSLDVTPGDRRDRISLALPPGAVIAGRIVDEYGEPQANVTVQALKEQFFEGRSVPGPTTGPADMTDDLGTFRLFGLPAGNYFLGANAAALLRSPLGQFTPPRSISPAERLYYPGTRRADEGQVVRLDSGAEVGGLVFVVRAIPGHRLTGMVRRADGTAVSAAVVSISEASMEGQRRVRRLRTRADGSFEAVGLESGVYTVFAASTDAQPATTSTSVTLDFNDATVTLILGARGPADPTAPDSDRNAGVVGRSETPSNETRSLP